MQVKILVIRFSSIGDIILTTPVLRALKTQLEGEVETHFLTKKKYELLLENNPHVDRIHSIERTVQEVLPQLETEGFDYIIDLHRNIRTSIVRRRLKTLSFVFKKYNFQKWLWVNLGINKMPKVHIVDRYMETLRGFGVKDDGLGLEYYIPEGVGIQPDQLPLTHRSGYIAWVVGAMHEGKKMSATKIGKYCAKIGYPIVLIGGKEDKTIGAEIATIAGPHVYDACGQYSIHESADCLRRSKLVVTGDTGMMHIASAFSKKILSLWGCTVPGFGMYPYRSDASSVILEAHGRDKRPCSKLGNHCKYGMDNKCIDQISEAELIAAIEKLLAQ
jgi:ADP-heptose:LPS heptosyltransferase